MLELLLRLVFSLAAVVGLMLLIARAVGKRFKGRPGAVVSVVHRQPISRHASIAVVTVGSRVLVLGATDQHVQMITELDPRELLGPMHEAGETADLATEPAAADEGLDVAIPGLAHLGVPPDAETATGRHRGPAGDQGRFARLLRAETEQAGTRPVAPVALVPRDAAPDGPLAGSLLSPATWRRALDAVTGRAS